MFDADDGASFLGSSPSPSPPRRSRSPSPGPLSLPPFLPVPHVSHTAVASGGAGTASRPRLPVPFPPPPPHRLSAREGDLIDLGGHVETNVTNGKLALVDGSGNVVTSSGLILQHGAATALTASPPSRSLHPKLGPGPVERAMARARAMSARPKPPVVEIVEEDDEEDGEIEIPNPPLSRRRSGAAAREIRHYSDFDPAVDTGVLSGPAGMAVMSVPSVTGGTAGHDVMEVDCEHPGAIGRWRERLAGRAGPRALSQQGGSRIQDVVSMFGGVNGTPGRPVQSQHWGGRIPSAHNRSSSASVSSFSQAGLKHIQNLGFRFTRRGSAVRAWLLAFAALLGLGTLVAINMAERGAMWNNNRNLEYENYGAYVLNSATNAGEPRPSSLSGGAVYVTYMSGDAEPGGAWDEFVYWADQHGRRYRSQHEQVGRFRVWSQNHERIKEKNRLHGPCPLTGALVFGDTHFKDLSPEEFKARHLNGYKPPVTHTSKKAKMAKMALSPGGPSADPTSKATGLSHHNPSRQVHHQYWGDMGWTSMHAEWKRALRGKRGLGKSTEATGRRLSSKGSGSIGSKYETHKRSGAKMTGKMQTTAKGQSQLLGSQYETHKRIDHWDGSGAQMTGEMQATAKGQSQPLGSQYETRKRIDHSDGSGAQMTGKMQTTAKGQSQPLDSQYETHKRIDHWDGSGAQMTGEMKATSMGQSRPLGSQYETHKRIDHWDGSGAQMTGEMKATSMGQSQPLGSQYETHKRIDHWDGSGAQMTGEMQGTAKGQSQPLGSQYETHKRIDHWDGSGAQMTGEMKATSMGQSQPLGSQYETHKRIDHWDGSGAQMTGEMKATSMGHSQLLGSQYETHKRIDQWDGSGAQMTGEMQSTAKGQSQPLGSQYETHKRIDHWDGSGAQMTGEMKATSMGQSQPLGSQYETHKKTDHGVGSGAQITGETQANPYGDSSSTYSSWKYRENRKKRYIDSWTSTSSSSTNSWKYRENRQNRYIDKWTGSYGSSLDSETEKTSSFTLWSCGWNALCWMRWIVAGTSMGFTSEPVYDSESYPTMVDWRQVGAVTSIHTQGYCGACWAITAVESIESAYFLYTGLLMDLYEAEVIACDDSCEMCDGGWPQNAYDYVVEMGGLPEESGYDDVFLVAMTAGDGNEYGYSTDSFDSFMDKTCPSSQYYEGVERYAAIKSYSYVTDRCVCYTDGSGCDCDEQDESTAVRNVASYGPASICIDASVMQDYTGGIITSDSGCSSEFMSMNHCVQVVGYAYTDGSGDEEGGSNSGDGNENNAQREGYWIIRNQWGNSWGMNGYAYMAMGDNTCGILNDMTQPFFD